MIRMDVFHDTEICIFLVPSFIAIPMTIYLCIFLKTCELSHIAS